MPTAVEQKTYSKKPMGNCEGCPNLHKSPGGHSGSCKALIQFQSPCFVRALIDSQAKKAKQ